MQNLNNKVNELIIELTNNLENLDNELLQKTEELVKQLCDYNDISMKIDKSSDIKYFYPDYNDLFLNIRKQRGYINYDKIELSENSIGLFKLKRHMSFNKSIGLTGACKDVIIELAKRKENLYEVRLLNYPYADIPTISKCVHRVITEEQIKYFCNPLDIKNEN